MKAQITEKINTKTIQFVWDTQVLYLQIKEYETGRKVYSISDRPEEEINFSYTITTGNYSTSASESIPKSLYSIPVALGKLETNYRSKGVKSQIEASKNVINNNIQFLKYIQEILDYIAELENDNDSESDI
jgi:hypothetical protein